MAILPLILSSFLFLLPLGPDVVDGTSFTVVNLCTFPVWPGILTSAGGAALGEGGFFLQPGASVTLPAPAGWEGRFWPRTDCTFEASGAGKCGTGDCAGGLKCTAGGSPPATLAEFRLNGYENQDFYDVSLVDGFNVGIGVKPAGSATGTCRFAGCPADLNKSCPSELQVVGTGGVVVACKSACGAFGSPEYCCTGDHGTPGTCPPTNYSNMFKAACPDAYSYAYDDTSSTRTCTAGGDYEISFCPTGP